MTAITFDTLSTARRLREKGIPQEHAEAIADELRESAKLDLSHLSTKEEAHTFKSELKSDILALRSELKSDIGALRSEFKSDIALMRSEMRESELRVTIRLGTMIVALGGILIAVKYFG